MKKYIYLLVSIAFLASSCTDDTPNKADYDFTPDPAALPAITVEVDNVGFTDATLTGSVTFGTDASFLQKGFVVSTAPDFAQEEVVKTDETFQVRIDNLADDATYYVKAWIATINGTAFSEVKTFTTLFAPVQWADLEGTWTVTEDFNSGGWYNNQEYEITITGDPGSKFRIGIDGFAPWQYPGGHTIYATVNEMKLTLTSQELLPGWDEPDYRTYIAALKTGTLADEAGSDFPVTDIVMNTNGKLEIKLLGGLQPYSYLIYDNDAADGSYAGAWGYCRNTTWTKQ
jgi:hypothetical protein